MVKLYTRNKSGFTLIELLITLGIVSITGITFSLIDMNSFRRNSFQAEIIRIGSALQTARTNSFNNINKSKHGVAFNPDNFKGYMLFEGDSYTSRDKTKDVAIKASYSIIFSSSTPTEIVFEQLSGNANYNGGLYLTESQSGISDVIKINYEGKIEW